GRLSRSRHRNVLPAGKPAAGPAGASDLPHLPGTGRVFGVRDDARGRPDRVPARRLGWAHTTAAPPAAPLPHRQLSSRQPGCLPAGGTVAGGGGAMLTDWMTQATCRDYDPELWFPDAEESGDVAMGHCRTCPVRGEWREYELDIGAEIE